MWDLGTLASINNAPPKPRLTRKDNGGYIPVKAPEPKKEPACEQCQHA